MKPVRLSVKDILHEAGVQSQEDVTDVAKALAEKVLVLGQRCRNQQSSIDSLKEKVSHLRSQSIREFLTEKGIGNELIEIVECDARNRGRKPQGRRFTKNDVVRSAAFLRGAGRRALSVASKMFILADRGTVNKYVQGIQIDCGIDPNGPFMEVLRDMASRMPDPAQRVVCVAWDEGHVGKGLYLSLKQRLLIGYEDFGDGDRTSEFADQTYFVQVQGVFCHFRFPVTVCFAKGATSKDKIVKIIPKVASILQSATFIVSFSSCDQANQNRAANKELEKKYPFRLESGEVVPGVMQINGQPIYIIYDVAHLVKCLRNMLVDGYILWPIVVDGKVEMFKLYWSDLEKMRLHLEKYGDTHVTRKLTENHLKLLSVPGGKGHHKVKMNVKLAMELLSETNAILFETVGVGIIPNSIKIAKVLRDLDMIIDLGNGCSSKEAASGFIKPARRPISADSIHHEMIPKMVEKLSKARLFKYKPETGTYEDHTNMSPTLRNFSQTLLNHLAFQKRAADMRISQTFNPRVGANSDPMECTIGETRQVSRDHVLTCFRMLYNIKSVFIADMVVPDNPHANVACNGPSIQASLGHFLSLPRHVPLQDRLVDGREEEIQEEVVDEPDLLESQIRGLHSVDLVESDPEIVDVFGPEADDEAIRDFIHEYDAIQLARDVRKLILRGNNCETCQSDFTGPLSGAVHAQIDLWEPHKAIQCVPSQLLLAFVKTGSRLFETHCRPNAYRSDIFDVVEAQLARISPTTWITCEEHGAQRRKSLISNLAVCLLRNFVRKTNKAIKEDARNKGLGPRAMTQVINQFADQALVNCTAQEAPHQAPQAVQNPQTQMQLLQVRQAGTSLANPIAQEAPDQAVQAVHNPQPQMRIIRILKIARPP